MILAFELRRDEHRQGIEDTHACLLYNEIVIAHAYGYQSNDSTPGKTTARIDTSSSLTTGNDVISLARIPLAQTKLVAD